MAPDDPEEDVALGARPAGDPLARAVARARIGGALFGLAERVTLGRYQLLERVGAGGMGVVWGAWDPELERRVAIKLVRARAGREHVARILAEGQALAKLSHPNVVPVYDVGVVDDEVYLVMEWVRGRTLRAWCAEPRTARELVALYRAAGEGLAAAHRAGLIHRDFKPDNAMLGEDGRVRVLDFGLAHDLEAGATDEPAGTPRYMAPEQAAGGAITAAVDQYALCVSLREALEARGEVPRWLAAILARGTAPEPRDRYPDVAALLAALARDPRTVWRRRALGGAVATAIGAAFLLGGAREHAAEPAPCLGDDDAIARTWSDEARDRLVAHLRTLGPYGEREARRLVPVLDRYRASWTDTRRRACLARYHHTSTPAMYETQVACLARTQVAFATVIDVLGRAERTGLGDAAAAAAGLPNSEACLVPAPSQVLPPPLAIEADVQAHRARLERVRVKARAGATEAVAEADELVARTATLGYGPLHAEALLEQGHAYHHTRDKAVEAIGMFAAASEQAFRAGDTATAIHAYAHLVYLVGTSDPAAPEGGRWRPYAEALPVVRWSAGHLTGPTSYARALLESSDGSLRLARGEPGAREAFQAALDAWTGDPEHVELFGLFANLAMVTDDAPRRDALFARAIEFLTHSLGPDHYTVLDTRLSAAMHVEHPRRAYEALGAACRELLALHAHHREPISTCHYELGWLAVALRDEAAATAAFARVTEPGPEREIARAYVAPDAASANRLAALARELAAENVPFLALRAADAGLIAARASDRSTARRVLEHGLAALDATRGFEHRAFFARRRAAVAAALARVGGPIERAREAAAFYRTAGGYEAALRELEPLTGSR